MEKKSSLPLNHCHVKKASLIINRSHALIHTVAIAFLIHYRASFFLNQDQEPKTPILVLLWVLVFASELLLSFIWLLGRGYKFRPVGRTAFPERLPGEEELPAIDVHICTVDPVKEPTFHVMNTVLSAMAMDYPVEKLHVYLSDDGGSNLTLLGMREAWRFGKWWVPFCRRFGIRTRCPEAYFSGEEDRSSPEFLEERHNVKEKYKLFKDNIKKAAENGKIGATNPSHSRDHSATIEIIREDDPKHESIEENVKMPLLVYVSREKRPQVPHNFKAGALNVLLRISGAISNSPYILVLDCDMYCNDPSSAKTAMCFHLDPQISSSLAFVQFPQRFHNTSKNDIYDSVMRSAFSTLWPGLDGLQGPVLSGSGFYMKRECLYGSFMETKTYPAEPKQKPNVASDKSSLLLQELASCTYENGTKWGKEVGYLYESVVEDVFTGFMLHVKGWTSVYVDPSRPQFLGSGITNLNDLLTQGTRWSCGLISIGLSRFCPLIYRAPKMSLLERLSYGELILFPLFYCTSLWCFATIPQLCLLKGISLYPKVSDPSFAIFSFIFISALAGHVHEVLSSGRSIRTMINEHRIWMIKSVTSHTYASLNVVLEKIGAREASFLPTNKVDDEDRVKLYQNGKFDFRTSHMFLFPLVFLVVLNLASLVHGVVGVVGGGCTLDETFVQVFVSGYVLVVNYPVLEAMVFRRDKGCVPMFVTLLSVLFLSVGYGIFMS